MRRRFSWCHSIVLRSDVAFSTRNGYYICHRCTYFVVLIKLTSSLLFMSTCIFMSVLTSLRLLILPSFHFIDVVVVLFIVGVDIERFLGIVVVGTDLDFASIVVGFGQALRIVAGFGLAVGIAAGFGPAASTAVAAGSVPAATGSVPAAAVGTGPAVAVGFGPAVAELGTAAAAETRPHSEARLCWGLTIYLVHRLQVAAVVGCQALASAAVTVLESRLIASAAALAAVIAHKVLVLDSVTAEQRLLAEVAELTVTCFILD